VHIVCNRPKHFLIVIRIFLGGAFVRVSKAGLRFRNGPFDPLIEVRSLASVQCLFIIEHRPKHHLAHQVELVGEAIAYGVPTGHY
jgi:hypothetical protein